MIQIYLSVAIFAVGIVAYFFFRKERATLVAENEKLRDQVLVKEEGAKVEKLEDKLFTDQKEGESAEKKYKDFVSAHADLFPPDSKGR